jgi:hypothetical protein
VEETEESGTTLVFGLPVEDMDSNIQPIDCLVLVKGINMETGSPMMVTVGSGGLPIWELIGMLEMEAARLKMMTVYANMAHVGEEDEDEEPID